MATPTRQDRQDAKVAKKTSEMHFLAPLASWRAWRFITLSIAAVSFARSAHATESITFTRDVAPIVFNKCATCHHPGEAAPFSLLSYDDVKKRATQIVDVTQKRFMPPWLPSEGTETFVGARRLSDRELETLQKWVAAGAPRGDEQDFPAKPVFTEGWQAGTPDLVLETPDYQLAAADRDVFRNFVVPVDLPEARWVQSIELRPMNPRITHHARLGVDSSNESVRRDAEDPEPGYAGMAWGQDPDGQLVIWAPGVIAHQGKPGVAWRLHAKTTLVLHTHMQPSGKPEIVKFRIGIRFAKEPPTQYPAMLRIGSCDIDIPSGAANHVVVDSFTLPVDVDVHTIFPHAHSLCKSLRVMAERPDGSREPLIAIEHFDENWHDAYQYAKPMRLPRGTQLISTFAYDNTDENLRNRNHPARRVVYGSNVTDEMADVYLQVTAANADERAALMESYKRYELQAQVAGYRRSLEMYPDNTWSQEALATCYVGMGRPGDAIAILGQRMKSGPRAVFPLVSLGLAQLANGELVAAETQLRDAVAMDENYPLAWFGLGKTLVAQKKFEMAEQDYRRAIALAPDLLEARLNLADLLIHGGQLDEATNVCTAALDDSPDMASVYLKLGEIEARRKKYDASLKHFEKAKQLAPYTHPAKVLLAVQCIANGEPERGVALLREARVESPEHPVPPLLLGQLARQQKQLAVARDYLEKAAALPTPSNWPASHKQRFLILLHSERFRAAEQFHDEPLARDALTQWIAADPSNRQLQTLLNDHTAPPTPTDPTGK